ncbi:MAG: hypothetical protein AAGK05_07670 [Pseudomonadota bacterium]
MATRRHACYDKSNTFCYICGCYAFERQRRNISTFVKRAYKAYFGLTIGDQDKRWAPHIVCQNCEENLRHWSKGIRKGLAFGIPMTWREPMDHTTDCYFCLVNVKGVAMKTKHRIKYPNIPSAIRPIPHSDELPVPVFEGFVQPSSDEEGDDVHVHQEDSQDPTYEPEGSSIPQKFCQAELNDLVRDLGLSKTAAELLASRLNEKNQLTYGTKITYFRNREKDFLPYFTEENNFVFCHDVPGLFRQLGMPAYDPNEWRLFLDSSKRSLKCVLLHNGNHFSSVPIGHSVHLKESHNDIKTVIELIKYHDHNWIICVDLKMVNFLLGQQAGFTKYPCFLCMWDSRARDQHWNQIIWPVRETLQRGMPNIVNDPIVCRDRIIFPPLHIKLGLMKQFVKALSSESECFHHICRVLPGLSFEKIKAGVFDGPQIRLLMRDSVFPAKMNVLERNAWTSFVTVVENFLGNRKADNYELLVADMLSAFRNLGCKMSVKLHYLYSHLDKFPDSLGAVSDEQGERFHQDLKVMEERYQGRWDKHMMADYCWSIHRQSLETPHKRKSYKRKFLPSLPETNLRS